MQHGTMGSRLDNPFGHFEISKKYMKNWQQQKKHIRKILKKTNLRYYKIMSSIFLEQITIFNFHLLIILEKVLEFSHSTLTSSCIKIKNKKLPSSFFHWRSQQKPPKGCTRSRYYSATGSSQVHSATGSSQVPPWWRSTFPPSIA